MKYEIDKVIVDELLAIFLMQPMGQVEKMVSILRNLKPIEEPKPEEPTDTTTA